MKRQNNKRVINNKEISSKSRKMLRKQKKQAKKQNKRQFYKNKSIKAHVEHQNKSYNQKQNKPVRQNNRDNAPNQKNMKRQEKMRKEKKVKIIEQHEDDRIIRQYQQKLGIPQGKDKYEKIAKKFGFDQDIFDFLKNISKKVKDSAYQYKNSRKNQNQQYNSDDQIQQNNRDDEQQQQQIQDDDEQRQQLQQDEQQYDNQQEEDMLQNIQQMQQQFNNQHQGDDSFDKQMDQMFDNLDNVDRSFYQQPYKSKQNKVQKINNKQVKIRQVQNQGSNIIQNQSKNNINQLDKNKNKDELIMIRKSMNGLFNKLSDGNILITFRSFMDIIQSHPRAIAIPIYSQLFTRFNLIIQKPLFHILATNIALLSSLHYAFGNRLLAPVMHTLTQKYIQLNNQAQDTAQILELGYSKRFQRLKNYAIIISLLYNYSSISGEYIQSYVNWLTLRLNKQNIQLIYIIVQKSGIKIRQNDPSILKSIINTINNSITIFKKSLTNQAEQMQKIHFIQLQLSQIKFNKKVINSTADQRMSFLQTFITKNVPKEIQTQKESFPLKFQDLINLDITHRTNWWEDQYHHKDGMNDDDQNEMKVDHEINQQKRKLIQLAKSFHLVTEIKKNIFLCLMQAKDYLQATQKILELKVHHLQDIATVLIQVCTLEPNFNPYYALVAAKIASITPKFRLNLQYAIWDHLKLIHQYELRRTSNLAKFSAKLISDPTSNSSLSILKYFPDLSNIRTIDTTFLTIFFKYFLKKVKLEYLSKLINKLRQKNNRGIKQGIKQFLSQFDCEQSDIKQKVRLCRRFLLIEIDQNQQFKGDEQ